MSSTLSASLLAEIWPALGGASADLASVRFVGAGRLPSAFAVTDLAAASVATAALAVGEWIASAGGPAPAVRVDSRLASLWFGFSLRPQGWSVPPPWDPVAGDYRSRDGWIRLHTNAPHHRRAAMAVLGTPEERDAVARAVAAWSADELETAIVQRGGCAAALRSLDAWRAHPQGRAVAAEPLFHQRSTSGAAAPPRAVDPTRPLRGIKVLDLTRVLAGPVATRFLAGCGATVLRIDPPGWDEPGVIPEVVLGKRCARLDLHDPGDRATFEQLLREADVLVHGYRPGALDALGFDAARRQALRPGLVDVSLSAYGWTGPWNTRRGFDSLVQMSSGIADEGRRYFGADRPTPLPVQALDQATGYLLAAAAVRGLVHRRRTGFGLESRTSLARIAALLVSNPSPPPEPLAPETADDLAEAIEATAWGTARRIRPPVEIAGAPLGWDLPARPLGSAPAAW